MGTDKHTLSTYLLLDGFGHGPYTYSLVRSSGH